MVTLEKGLLSLFKVVSIGAATAGGGPAFGAKVAMFLETDAGKFALEQLVRTTLNEQATPMAMGGLVNHPTFALIGEAGPEMVIPTTPKKKRKVSAYQREFGRQYKRLKGRHTLKNGSMRKGWTPKRLMSSAHTAAKKARK